MRAYAARSLVAIVWIGLSISLQSPLFTNELIVLLEERLPRAAIGNGEEVVVIITLGGNSDRIRQAARLARLYSHLDRWCHLKADGLLPENGP